MSENPGRSPDPAGGPRRRQKPAPSDGRRLPARRSRPERPGTGRIRRFRARLLAWYDAHRRDLPWRRRPDDAWAQLVAEFMLQQTQVATVTAYYERFLRRFPTVESLARAPQEAVLALWSGLGYYRRARMLHEAARRIVREHGGEVPSTVDELARLPGIGRYTAGAIASIVFGRREPVLDGNVRRVLIRWQATDGDPDAPDLRKRLWDLAEALVPRRRPGDFNQSLMELGATVCTPRAPGCGVCPLRRSCAARRLGLTEILPRAKRRRTPEALNIVALAVERDGRLLFVRRPARGLWGGLWDLPTEAVACGERPTQALRRLVRRLAGGRRAVGRPVGRITRLLTHRKVTFRLYRLTGTPAARGIPAGRLAGDTGYRWLKPDESGRVGVSRAVQSLIAMLDRHRSRRRFRRPEADRPGRRSRDQLQGAAAEEAGEESGCGTVSLTGTSTDG